MNQYAIIRQTFANTDTEICTPYLRQIIPRYTVAVLVRRITKLDKQNKRLRNLPAIFRTKHCKDSGFGLVVRIYRFIIVNHKHMSLQMIKLFF